MHKRYAICLSASLLVCAALLFCSCGLIIINETSPDDTGEVSGSSDTSASGQTGGQDTRPPSVDETDYEALSKQAFDALSVSGMSGVRFSVACADTTFFIGDGTETVLTSDRVRRVSLLESKFDTSLNIRAYTVEDLYAGVSAAYLSGEYFADLLALPQAQIGLFSTDGLLMNLRSVPGFHLDSSAFNKSSIFALSAGHEIYGLTGDGAFEPEKLLALYFNRDIAGTLGLGDIYDVVRSGQWTLDKYALCVKTAADNKIQTAVYDGDLNLTLLMSSGFTFTENGTDKTPAALTFTEGYSALINFFSALSPQAQSDTPQADFLSGSALFYAGSLTDAAVFTDAGFNWGLIPFPKLDADADYSSGASPDAVIFCIPAGSGSAETAGDFITALCVLSENYIKYNFVKHNMYYVLRDSASVGNMLKVIDGVYYDFSMMISSGYKTLYADTVTAFSGLVSGELTYEKYLERQQEFKEYLEHWFPVIYE